MFNNIENHAKSLSLRTLTRQEIENLNTILMREAETDPNGARLSFENFSTMTFYPNLKVLGFLKHDTPVGLVQIILDGKEAVVQKIYVIPEQRGWISPNIYRDIFFDELKKTGVTQIRFDWAQNDITCRLEKFWRRLLKNHKHIIFPNRTCHVDLIF